MPFPFSHRWWWYRTSYGKEETVWRGCKCLFQKSEWKPPEHFESSAEFKVTFWAPVESLYSSSRVTPVCHLDRAQNGIADGISGALPFSLWPGPINNQWEPPPLLWNSDVSGARLARQPFLPSRITEGQSFMVYKTVPIRRYHQSSLMQVPPWKVFCAHFLSVKHCRVCCLQDKDLGSQNL